MSNLDSNLLIDTPENLALEAEIAGFGSRFVAAFIDYLIIYGTLFTFGCLFARSITFETEGQWGVALLFLIQYAIFFFYHLIFEYVMNGQTPGKRRIGIRVVQSNGMPLTVTGMLIRNFVRMVDFLPVLYGFGLLMFFITKKTQRLGDLAARTIVIREQPQMSVRSLQRDYAITYIQIQRNTIPPDYINLDYLTEQDRHMIINYLQRRVDLSTREVVVVPFALQIARRIGVEQQIPIYSPRAAETLLEHIVRAFELRDQGEWPPRPVAQPVLADQALEQPMPDRAPVDADSPSSWYYNQRPTDPEDTPESAAQELSASDWMTANAQYYRDHIPDAADPPPDSESDSPFDAALLDDLPPDEPPDEPDDSWQRLQLD